MKTSLPIALLIAAGAGSTGLVFEGAPRTASQGLVPYALAALAFFAAAASLARDPRRGRLLAIAGAVLLAAWVVAIGYGGSEPLKRGVAVLGVAAAVIALQGAPFRWVAFAVSFLAVLSAPLLYVLLVHPPLGLLAIYAVAATSVSAAVPALLPATTRRWSLAAQAAIALVAWVAGAALLLLAYGLPLAAS